MFLQKAYSHVSEINPEINDPELKMKNYEETEREVNSKILKISLKINDQYPELSKYLEEIPVNVPVDKKPEITLRGLSTYYDSLNVLLSFHIKEHSLTQHLKTWVSQTE